MKPFINNPVFREAVTAIDTGDLPALKKLLSLHPGLVRERLDVPREGYFKQPYLLWFIANNPIRDDKLPANIIDITRMLIEAVQLKATDSMHSQFDYTLALVATGRIPRESGKQIELMDLLIDAGATPGNGVFALAHGNKEAAAHLARKRGELTFPEAVGLDRRDDIRRLARNASKQDKQVALMIAAFYGKADIVAFLLEMGAEPNLYIDASSGFHSHATALHQAVFSASLDTVRILVETGAGLELKDKIYNSTPAAWAEYALTGEATDTETRRRFLNILEYLKSKQ